MTIAATAAASHKQQASQWELFMANQTTAEHLHILDDLLDLEEGLTDWEATFVESLNRQRIGQIKINRRPFFTPRQIYRLEQIANDKL